MKRAISTPVIDDLKSMYKKELNESSAILLDICKRIKEDEKINIMLSSGWLNDFVPFGSNPNNQEKFNLVTLHNNSNEKFYAIPVVQCNPDGSSIKKAGWQGKKIWTLYIVLSADTSDTTVLFVPNRYSGNWLYPDFKQFGYKKNFGYKTQDFDIKNYKKQKYFDIERYIECFYEKEKFNEEVRRNEKMTITVGMWEDLLEELRTIKEKL